MPLILPQLHGRRFTFSCDAMRAGTWHYPYTSTSHGLRSGCKVSINILMFQTFGYFFHSENLKTLYIPTFLYNILCINSLMNVQRLHINMQLYIIVEKSGLFRRKSSINWLFVNMFRDCNQKGNNLFPVKKHFVSLAETICFHCYYNYETMSSLCHR